MAGLDPAIHAREAALGEAEKAWITGQAR